MGRVWLAEHITLDRKVAVKVISDEAISTPEMREQFNREAQATAKVDSPHVVRVLDYDCTDDGHPFLVLELLKGETLEDRILRAGPLVVDEAKELLDQISDALGVAHSCGILHRDMKAENLFLQASDRPIDMKLLDFGIALSKTDRSVLGQGPIGTPQYMSPEQMTGEPITERSDLFSLSVCMYYALTGAFPFLGETFAMISVSCTQGVFIPPSTLRRGLPVSLDAWFAKALAVDPSTRFATTKELRETFALAVARRPRLLRDTPFAVEVALDRPTLEVSLPVKSPRRWAGLLLAVATVSACAGLVTMRGKLGTPVVAQAADPVVATVESSPVNAALVAPLPVVTAPIVVASMPSLPIVPAVQASKPQVAVGLKPAKNSAAAPVVAMSTLDASVESIVPATETAPSVAPSSSAFVDPYGATEFGPRE